MLKDFFKVEELVEILGVYEVSAQEILGGTLQLEDDELLKLSEHTGISVDELLKLN